MASSCCDVLQTLAEYHEGSWVKLDLPSANELFMPGIRWGLAHALFTPAFWAAQWWYARRQHEYASYCNGRSLREEVIACLLGGHSITAEMNEAAFERLRSRDLLDGLPSTGTIAAALTEPMMVRGRWARYRFPKQKARFLCEAMRRLERETPPADDLLFRDWLMDFPGIGAKTASWITRNWLHSNRVAIIDVHVFRAGTIAGLFRGTEVIARDYGRLEAGFLRFADALAVEARQLDVFVWWKMKRAGKLGIQYFERKLASSPVISLTSPPPPGKMCPSWGPKAATNVRAETIRTRFLPSPSPART